MPPGAPQPCKFPTLPAAHPHDTPTTWVRTHPNLRVDPWTCTFRRGGVSGVSAAMPQPPTKASALFTVRGEPLIYPVPVFVRNTFVDVPVRQPSLEAFIVERQVRSCPASSIEHLEGNDVDTGSGSDWAVAGSAAAGRQHQETISDCSTTDALDKAAAVVEATAEDAHGASGGDSRAFVHGHSAPGRACLRRSKTWSRGFVQLSGGADLDHEAEHEHETEQEPEHPAGWGHECTAATSSPSWPDTDDECAKAHLVLPAHLLAPARPVSGSGTVAAVVEEVAAAPVAKVASEVGEEVENTELPSAGSAGHESGQCKPCAFFSTKGCQNGVQCQFCHLCEPGEKKRRRKEKMQFRSTMRQLRKLAGPGAWAGGNGGSIPSWWPTS